MWPVLGVRERPATAQGVGQNIVNTLSGGHVRFRYSTQSRSCSALLRMRMWAGRRGNLAIGRPSREALREAVGASSERPMSPFSDGVGLWHRRDSGGS